MNTTNLTADIILNQNAAGSKLRHFSVVTIRRNGLKIATKTIGGVWDSRRAVKEFVKNPNGWSYHGGFDRDRHNAYRQAA